MSTFDEWFRVYSSHGTTSSSSGRFYVNQPNMQQDRRGMIDGGWSRQAEVWMLTEKELTEATSEQLFMLEQIKRFPPPGLKIATDLSFQSTVWMFRFAEEIPCLTTLPSH